MSRGTSHDIRGGLITNAVLLPAALVLVGLPSIPVLIGIASNLLDRRESGYMPSVAMPGLAVAISTLGYAGTIAALATALGVPAGWWIGRARTDAGLARLVALAVVPLLLPGYLIYAGWGFLRGPGSSVGNWLALQSPDFIVLVNRATAVVGLALWSWPIAALLVAAGARRIPRATLDLLALEPAGPMTRGVLVFRLLGPSLLRAFAAIAMLMLGSAIPLHVARARTWAIELWAMMNLTAGTDSPDVWLGALPLLLIACAAATVAWLWMARARTEHGDDQQFGEHEGPVGLVIRMLCAVVWSASVIAPLLIFLWMLREPASLWRWWGEVGSALVASVDRGVVVGAILGALTVGTWFAASAAGTGARARWTLAICAIAFGTACLCPGVLVGLAWNCVAASTWPQGGEGGHADSPAMLVIVHLARFGFFSMLLGAAMAAGEPREQRWNRLIDGGDGLRGWAKVELVGGGAWVVLGWMMVGTLLSVHEIEAAVMVQPPGMQTLAQQLLDDLHFSRDERLAAAGANLLIVGSLLALVAGWLMAQGQGWKRTGGERGERGASGELRASDTRRVW